MCGCGGGGGRVGKAKTVNYHVSLCFKHVVIPQATGARIGQQVQQCSPSINYAPLNLYTIAERGNVDGLRTSRSGVWGVNIEINNML